MCWLLVDLVLLCGVVDGACFFGCQGVGFVLWVIALPPIVLITAVLVHKPAVH